MLLIPAILFPLRYRHRLNNLRVQFYSDLCRARVTHREVTSQHSLQI